MKKNLLEYINQARHIAYVCNTRANELDNQAAKIKHPKDVKKWLENQNKKDILKLRAALLRDRAVKVWGSVTSYQGKYINYRDVHTIDGITYHGIISLIDGSFNHLSYSKYSL